MFLIGVLTEQMQSARLDQREEIAPSEPVATGQRTVDSAA
jgi:hypothetical protein